MRRLPAGTVTFLFTDVEGSTRLLHELGAQRYAAELAEHRRLLRAAFAHHEGVEVDTQGDAFFAAFPTAPAALAAAAELTDALRGGPIRVRVGVHTGTPLVTEEGYVGPDVHRAARIGAAAHGGQVVVSAPTAALAGPDGMRDLGEHRFKDLADPERVFQLGEEEFPPLKSLYRTNLPVPATPFLGRERELAEVVELLVREDVRLLTLAGPGGTGKTRLALQAAAEAADRFPDGVWWVPLAPLRDGRLVLPTMAHALELKEDAGRPLRDALVAALSGRRLLVLLDNAEQVLPELAHELTPLRQAEGPMFLVTSRERLQLDGEHLFDVPPLDEDDAVELFLARAASLGVTLGRHGAIEELCHRLDALPLAIELAAARTRLFTPSTLLACLEQRLPILGGGSRDLPERQRTLEATIEWSYELLTDAEQRLFADIGIFAGGLSLEAAEAVCGATLDGLASLVDKSMLRHDTGPEGEPRFGLLATMREYARARLDARGDAYELARRHAAYFLALAARAEPELGGPRQGAWIARLRAELGNLRAARIWFRLVADRERAARLATSVWPFLLSGGYLTEGRIWLDEVIGGRGSVRPELRAKALFGAAILAVFQGAYAEARSYAEEALALARRLGDASLVARALDALGLAAQGERDFAQAASLFEECRRLSRKIGDDWLLGIAINNLGDLALNEGEYQRAAALFEESLALGRRHSDPERISRSLANLASATLELGRHELALPMLRESLDRALEAGLVEVVPMGLEGVAAVAATAGDSERAATLVAKAQALMDEMGARQPSFEQARNERILEQAREDLGADTLAAARAAGATMSLDEALALVYGDG